jgi:hypothetical protein
MLVDVEAGVPFALVYAAVTSVAKPPPLTWFIFELANISLAVKLFLFILRKF